MMFLGANDADISQPQLVLFDYADCVISGQPNPPNIPFPQKQGFNKALVRETNG